MWKGKHPAYPKLSLSHSWRFEWGPLPKFYIVWTSDVSPSPSVCSSRHDGSNEVILEQAWVWDLKRRRDVVQNDTKDPVCKIICKNTKIIKNIHLKAFQATITANRYEKTSISPQIVHTINLMSLKIRRRYQAHGKVECFEIFGHALASKGSPWSRLVLTSGVLISVYLVQKYWYQPWKKISLSDLRPTRVCLYKSTDSKNWKTLRKE